MTACDQRRAEAIAAVNGAQEGDTSAKTTQGTQQATGVQVEHVINQLMTYLPAQERWNLVWLHRHAAITQQLVSEVLQVGQNATLSPAMRMHLCSMRVASEMQQVDAMMQAHSNMLLLQQQQQQEAAQAAAQERARAQAVHEAKLKEMRLGRPRELPTTIVQDRVQAVLIRTMHHRVEAGVQLALVQLRDGYVYTCICIFTSVYIYMQTFTSVYASGGSLSTSLWCSLYPCLSVRVALAQFFRTTAEVPFQAIVIRVLPTCPDNAEWHKQVYEATWGDPWEDGSDSEDSDGQ